jgi:hypothetical protein
LVNPYDEEPADHIRFAGPLVFHLTDKGLLSREILALDRSALFDRRADKVKNLQHLLDLWRNAVPEAVRDAYWGEIIAEAAADSEYAGLAYDFLSAWVEGVPDAPSLEGLVRGQPDTGMVEAHS